MAQTTPHCRHCDDAVVNPNSVGVNTKDGVSATSRVDALNASVSRAARVEEDSAATVDVARHAVGAQPLDPDGCTDRVLAFWPSLTRTIWCDKALSSTAGHVARSLCMGYVMSW